MKKLKVLIVEDEAIIALDIESKLLSNGYIVSGVAHSYQAGIELIEKDKPDIILMDIIIQGEKSGIDLASQIHKQYRTPVIFVSANNQSKILEKTKAVNPYGFISKPINNRDLYSTIEIAYHKFLYEETILKTKQELEKINENLEERVAKRTREIREANKLLKLEKQKSIESFIKGENQERKRVASELHDGISQKLTAAKFSIASVLLKQKLPSETQKVLLESKKIIEETMNEVREISHNLTPSFLIDYGLEPALNKMCDRLNEKSSINVALKSHNVKNNLTLNQKTNLYRIIQEGIVNAIKHSKASQVTVELNGLSNNFITKISDNGIGFNDNQKQGLGIRSMQDRSDAINAHFSIWSKPKQGTIITITLNENSISR